MTEILKNISNININTDDRLSFLSKRGRFLPNSIEISAAALLIIDVQKYFFDPSSEVCVASSGRIFDNVLSSIEFFSSRKRALIFTRHAEKRNSPEFPKDCIWRSRLYEDMPESNFYEKLPIQDADKVIVKQTFSAFHNTELAEFLKKEGIRFVFMCGVNTHICIESSARAAFDCGFLPIVLADACASWKDEQHFRSLKNISDGIGWVANCSDLAELK